MKTKLNHNGDSPDVGKGRLFLNCAVEKWLTRHAHNVKIVGSNPTCATILFAVGLFILSGCVTTSPLSAPSTSPIKNSIQSAQEANKRAGEATASAGRHVAHVSSNLDRIDAKVEVLRESETP